MRVQPVWMALLAALLLLTACAAPAAPVHSSKEAAQVREESLPAGGSEAVFGCDALFFGDSITADSEFDRDLPGLRVVNLGVYGDRLEDLLRRVPQVQAEAPARIFLLGGINSLQDDRLEACVDQYRELLAALREACPASEIVVQTVLPVGAEITQPLGCSNETIRAFNLRLRALAEEFGLECLDLYSAYEKDGALDPELTRDGVHLNFNAYGPWAELLQAMIGDGSHAAVQ